MKESIRTNKTSQGTGPALPDLAPAIALANEIRSRRGSIRFRVYERMLAGHELGEMELSVRSENCLRRANLSTAGELAERINGMDDLVKHRNLGKKSAQEIMYKLFLLQYAIMPAERRAAYLEDVAELNR